MYESKIHTEAIDWWALGVLLYQLLLRRLPFGMGGSENIEKECLSLKADLVDVDNSGLNSGAKVLIKQFFEKDLLLRIGTGRMGSAVVRNQLWFQEIDWYDVIYSDILMRATE